MDFSTAAALVVYLQLKAMKLLSAYHRLSDLTL